MSPKFATRSFRIVGCVALIAALAAASSYFFDHPRTEQAFGDRPTAGWVAAVLCVCGVGLLFLWRWAAILFAIPFAIVAAATLVELPSRFVLPESLVDVVMVIVCLLPGFLTWRGWSVLRKMIRIQVTHEP